MIPCRWDGTAEGLPEGIDAVFEGCMRPADAPDAASALAIEIRTDHQGRGLSARTLQAMAAICAEHGLHRLIAPVRPSWKERYPTVPIERYAAWQREDGLPFDPWLRVHACGWRRDPHARAAVDADHGDRGGVGGVDGLAYPESGEYVFPRGLPPLRVDREGDRGVYFEPNVWMAHRSIDAGAAARPRRAFGVGWTER